MKTHTHFLSDWLTDADDDTNRYMDDWVHIYYPSRCQRRVIHGRASISSSLELIQVQWGRRRSCHASFSLSSECQIQIIAKLIRESMTRPYAHPFARIGSSWRLISWQSVTLFLTFLFSLGDRKTADKVSVSRVICPRRRLLCRSLLARQHWDQFRQQ